MYSVSNTGTGPVSETPVNTVSVPADDCSRDETCHLNSNINDKVVDDSSTAECRSRHSELLTVENANTHVSTECEPCEHTATSTIDTVHHRAEIAGVCSGSSVPDMSSLDTAGVVCHKSSSGRSEQRHRDCVETSAADTSGNMDSSVRLFQPNLPAFECVQRRSFASTNTYSVSDKTDVAGAESAESEIRASGLRSDFDRRAQLKCAPLKLISQLDGPVPDSESDISDEEANVPESCAVVLSRSLAAPSRHRFAMDHGVSSPFKCMKCRRIYRTEESCALHSTVCMFEVSSSSDSEEPDCDEPEALGPSDEDSDSCCSDDGDDGMISDYLTSSRVSESAANCSSFGCQSGTLTSEDCDVNANCKTLCDSNVDVQHFRPEAGEEPDSVGDKIENKVGWEACDVFSESCASTLQYVQNTLVTTRNVSCGAETEDIPRDCSRPTAVDVSVQVGETVVNHEVRARSGRMLTECASVGRESVACSNEHAACESVESQTTREPSVFHIESMQSCDDGVETSCSGTADSPDVRRTLVGAVSTQIGDIDSNQTAGLSKSAERSITIDQQMTSLYGTTVSSGNLAEEQRSSLILSNRSSSETVLSTNYDTVKEFSTPAFRPCSGTGFHSSQSGASGSLATSFPWNVGHVTSSSSDNVPLQQCAMKLQEMLTSSASMVWPSATVSPSRVNNISSSNGIRTQLLAAPWVPLGVLTTASVVIPTGLPNAAAWIQPLNIAQPLYALGQSHARALYAAASGQIQSPSFSQFVRPALVTPVTWLAPQLAVMNAVNMCRTQTPHPAVSSTYSSHYVPSQQSRSSTTFAADVPSASQRPMLSLYSGTEHQSAILQTTVNSMPAHASHMTPTRLPLSSFRLPLVAVEPAQSVSLTTLASQQSLRPVVFSPALSRCMSVPLSPAALPSLYSSLLNTDGVSVNHRQVNDNPLASLIHHVSSATPLSQYSVGCGSVSSTWSTGATPMTLSSLSSSNYKQKDNLLASLSVPGRLNAPVAVCRMEPEVKTANVTVAAEDWSARRLDGLMRVHSDTTAVNLPVCQSTTLGHWLLSEVAAALKSEPLCLTTLSTSLVQSSACPVLVSSAKLSSWSSGVVCDVVNCLPVVSNRNSAKSPRLIIQPSSLTINTDSEVLKNLAQSISKTQPYAAAHLPPVTTNTHSLPASGVVPGGLQTCDMVSFSSTYSQLSGSAMTSLSNHCNVQVSRPLPWAATSVGTVSESVHCYQIHSPVNNTETTSSAGKCHSLFCVDCSV